MKKPSPYYSGALRTKQASDVRSNAANLRPGDPIRQQANDDLLDLTDAAATFSKGLPHDQYGRAWKPALDALIGFLDQARPDGAFSMPDPTGEQVVLGPRGADGHLPPMRTDTAPYLDSFVTSTDLKVRRLESPLGGHVFSLQGPDADAVSMPPAPAFGSAELTVEMAEVYALALLRDVPFRRLTDPSFGKVDDDDSTATEDVDVKEILDALLALDWYTTPATDSREEARRKARALKEPIEARHLFRGSTPGAQAGPYLSQFLLIGSPVRGAKKEENRGRTPALRTAPEALSIAATDDKSAGGAATSGPLSGLILYGVQSVAQKYRPHLEGKDYMTRWAEWIDIQNGADVKGDKFNLYPRFITTPRDLATYVHYDALYQAYLNACLLLLSYEHPFDRGLPESQANQAMQPRQGFATFGGPHILSLVAEVATRALKAVRRQKFNIHLRARPEAVAGVLTHAASADADELDEETKTRAGAMSGPLKKLLELVQKHNQKQNEKLPDWTDDVLKGWISDTKNYLLPMAFPEGSPMHPSYGAGHATVAGACVTILKAFFEMFEDGNGWTQRTMRSLYGEDAEERNKTLGRDGLAETSCIFAPAPGGETLDEVADPEGLTILGELDKLAANIAIGRDMAGVHYYTDYYESLRMGERVAVGLLQEQMLTYPEPVEMRLITFDREKMTIRGAGDGETVTVTVEDESGQAVSFDDWFRR